MNANSRSLVRSSRKLSKRSALGGPNLFRKALPIELGRGAARSAFPTMSFDQYLELFQFGNQTYPFLSGGTLVQGIREEPDSFRGAVEQAYRGNGVVFACELVRMLLFSEARFQFRQMVNGRPGDLYGTRELVALEKPWPNGTTGDLLSRMLMDADLEGNSFTARGVPVGGQPRLQRLPPDWVTIVAGSKLDADNPLWQRDAEVIGYLYHPGGPGSGQTPEPLLAEQVAHFAPIPDPLSRFRGMSWLTPVIREILGDSAAMTHKNMFFQNGATPNVVVSMPNVGDQFMKPEVFEKWIEVFEAEHAGVMNAYKTLYFGGGAEVKVIGSDLHQIDFKEVQGHGETRIAAAAGVPPVVVGLSEGLAAATYSNYSQARRRLADGTMRPLWRNAAASLSQLIAVPNNSELWYDDRDIPFLFEDVEIRANVLGTQMTTINAGIAAGFDPDEVVKAVTAGDLQRLVGKHTGLVSVQLQKPGTTPGPGGTGGSGNGGTGGTGNGKPPVLPAPKPSSG